MGGDEVTQAKPHPQGLRLALERLGLSAEQVLFCGDTAGLHADGVLEAVVERLLAFRVVVAGEQGIAVGQGEGARSRCCSAATR
mgnify:CR=1 FL=1